MRRSVVVLVAFLVCSSGAFASQPGQPLDCSDWEFFDPALRCSTLQEYSAPLPNGQTWKGALNNAAFDNLGRIIRVFATNMGGSMCFNTIEIVAFDWRGETLLGRLSYRSGWEWGRVDDCLYGGYIGFDPLFGRLLLALRSLCRDAGAHCPADYPELEHPSNFPPEPLGDWTVAIEGFTPLFDLSESYTPTSGNLGFRVPQRPEGLPAADRFDTYWGQVTRPLDLSQARPLQCAYPDHQPQVGEYLTFPNSAPTPSPGQAVYYLTSLTYQGQTRAGRQAPDGRLSGRDATLLPPCGPPRESAQGNVKPSRKAL